MSRLNIKRFRRLRKQRAAGRRPAPVGGHPGSGQSHPAVHPGAALKGRLQAGAGVLTKQVLQHFAGVDLSAVTGAAAPGMHGFGGHRRRMKATNVKALRRALRRVDAFAKIAKKVMHFAGHRTTGRPKFHFRRKKRAA